MRGTPLLALMALGAFAQARAQRSPAADSTGTIQGVVVLKGTSLPLAYSVVSIPAIGRERFTNDAGAFTLTDAPVGRVTIRVRHIGYLPTDLTITVRPRAVTTVRVELARLAVRLAAVKVHSYPPCTQPGPPDRAKDSSFAQVFDQLRQNADQFRLVTEQYPFRSAIERTQSRRLRDQPLRVEVLDTLGTSSAAQWKYDVGSLVTHWRPIGSNADQYVFRIPNLTHFADQRFLANHCFYNGGPEDVDGSTLLRIDLRAASRITQPDIDGSVYLDPGTFQIRRSVLTLSRLPPEVLGLESMSVTTLFTEILPSISIIGSVSSISLYDPNVPLGSGVVARTEEQRLLKVVFLRGRPGVP